MKYFCSNCNKVLHNNQRKFCGNICKCKFFYKNNKEKCNKWNREHPKKLVNNKCASCEKYCGRKKYCSDKCKPVTIRLQPHWRGMARFNSSCYICGKTFLLLCVHHKDGNHKNNKKNNLISLCFSCHSKTHCVKKYFKKDNSKLLRLEKLRKLLI